MDGVQRADTKERSNVFQRNNVDKTKPYCPYCNVRDHFLGSCLDLRKLSKNDIMQWIKEKERCTKCGRTHKDKCTLKKSFYTCKELHLTIVHDIHVNKSTTVMFASSPSELLYIDKPNCSHKVMLKVVNVCLHNGERTRATHAILVDGADRSVLFPQTVHGLGLTTQPKTISLCTVRQDIVHVNEFGIWNFSHQPAN